MSEPTAQRSVAPGYDIEKNAGILDLRREIHKRRGPVGAAAEIVGQILATPTFFFAFLAIHAGWVVLNLPFWPYEPWDPYPFPFLATVTSAEAPFIALLVLMHQRRNARIDELRQEMDLQVSLHVEREVTAALRLLREIQNKLNVPTAQDPELLKHLQDELDPERLMEEMRQKLDEDEGNDSVTAL
jgi:uncharacterized membrane protein